MELKEYFNLLNFGLVVLIWLVQLIIYPGFAYYSHDNLIKWHQVYTTAITLIVMPLMLGQLAISVLMVFQNTIFINILVLILILVLWVITFKYAVPAHGKINEGIQIKEQVAYLIKINWSRTILWTLVFVLGKFLT